ncbi:DUF5696 domain-containing protein [Butyrivibrio sp. INlla16]|uniref:DUF5696 domain-containing protein n=1 Tax=Butyrivibrio sp. INlla16 TaxID=1520807 RepID=UPI00088CFBB9|nr:DUF5696 domain-containing protein [Butyrivibrio sp. INlla16]SDB27044.1 hypothetical protein SAMN02910263_01300 [Butyrivibrio sp. INlla16]
MKDKKNGKIRQIVKSLAAPVIICALILAAVIFIINHKNASDTGEAIVPYSYEGGEDAEPIIVENDKLKLEMDPLTTQFTVTVKETGKVWRSNPENAATDSVALPEEKANLQSPLIMSYAVVTGLETTYNTYAYSTSNQIYNITQDGDSIRVDYSLGDVIKEYVIPPVITKDSLDAWLDKMDKGDVNFIQQYYKKYDINKLGKKDNKDELLANYPALADNVIYVLRDKTKENVRKKMEAAFEAAGYTYDDFLADKAQDLSVKSSDKPVFNVSVVYKLDGNDLVVEVPMKDLAYKEDSPIYTLTPLPYFGAGGTDEEGYMFVPEGGGATINFNNGKTSQSSYYTNVYGWDMCLSRDAVVHNTRAYYGVFGVAEGDDSFICILEEGSPYASIQADISGKNNSYNYVNAVYSICQREQYDVGDIANSDVYEYVPSLPDETLTRRYTFINSGNYVDMAKEYGTYLDNKYGDSLAMNNDESAPVAIEIVGAIDKVRQILGVPVKRPLKLTSYKEAADMIKDLSACGVKNMSVKLTGWCNGGVDQKLLKKAKPIGSLGSKKDLKNLAKVGEETDSTIYLNGITQYANSSNLLDGFFSYRDAAKLISKEQAKLYDYSHITYAQRENSDHLYYLLHTNLAMNIADKFAKAVKTYNAGVSFQDMGKDLSSDFYRKKTQSRQSVKGLQEEEFKKIQSEGTPIMINMGNDYAVPYASMVTDMDLRGSEYTILDQCVPFYQLAVHGKVNYTGDSVNVGGNQENEVLYSAEYGAGLQFTFMKETSFATQKTLYTDYYGATYDSWKDKMVEIYTRYNEELGHTFNQEMVDHENITEDLSRTEYADGTNVYVNYGYSDVQTPDGKTVPARDYLVVR